MASPRRPRRLGCAWHPREPRRALPVRRAGDRSRPRRGVPAPPPHRRRRGRAPAARLRQALRAERPGEVSEPEHPPHLPGHRLRARPPRLAHQRVGEVASVPGSAASRRAGHRARSAADARRTCRSRKPSRACSHRAGRRRAPSSTRSGRSWRSAPAAGWSDGEVLEHMPSRAGSRGRARHGPGTQRTRAAKVGAALTEVLRALPPQDQLIAAASVSGRLHAGADRGARRRSAKARSTSAFERLSARVEGGVWPRARR